MYAVEFSVMHDALLPPMCRDIIDYNILKHVETRTLAVVWKKVKDSCIKELQDIGLHLCVQQGRSALLLAAWKGQASICRLLIENGANINETDNDGRFVKLFVCITV